MISFPAMRRIQRVRRLAVRLLVFASTLWVAFLVGAEMWYSYYRDAFARWFGH